MILNHLKLRVIQNMMDINKNLFQWSIYFFDQKFSGSFASPGAGAKSKTKPNHKLADE